ncbi:DNA ligase [candidate division WWE3 bacterium CG_4_9_14_3_um_filter_41_6]|nr:MAG: DNA ligase [candidate division WWE3 bacterium CG_4_9_14_3_um_filter_41_6]
MLFTEFANYLAHIEQTSSRNEITVQLAGLFTHASSDEIAHMCYLVLGNLGPAYDRKEFGISQKTLLKCIARAAGKEQDLVDIRNKELGDVGDLALKFLKENRGDDMSVIEVFNALSLIASYQGVGSQEQKIEGLSQLLQRVDGLSAKYIARIPVQKLRLGFSDMTILDALSYMVSNDKSHRTELERAFNVRADIGYIAQVVKREGIQALSKVTLSVGVPVRPAAAERMPSAALIIDKLGPVAVEPKVDGFRLQVHVKKGSPVRMFSRNLEDMSKMFPEVALAVETVPVESMVFEGEAIAVDEQTGDMLPFQETMQRRRTHGVAQKAQELPLTVFCFDLLYLNGKVLLDEPYVERRRLLTESLGGHSKTLLVVDKTDMATGDELSEYFYQQLEAGYEGIMTKRLDAPYSAGKRSNNWVKLKREDRSDLNDTVDCVVMGYKFGKGRRNSFGIGAFLVGVFDEEDQMYKTISNVGTGLTDEQWKEMKSRSDTLQVKHKPNQYDVASGLTQDVWIEPSMVVEILADTITRSPNHTAGKVGDDPGYALRFPRLVQWRDDKSPEQATSVKEIQSMFKNG